MVALYRTGLRSVSLVITELSLNVLTSLTFILLGRALPKFLIPTFTPKDADWAVTGLPSNDTMESVPLLVS